MIEGLLDLVVTYRGDVLLLVGYLIRYIDNASLRREEAQVLQLALREGLVRLVVPWGWRLRDSELDSVT